MFTEPDTDVEYPADIAEEASPVDLRDIYAQAPLTPLDQLAFHVDDAMETKAMLDDAEAMTAARPALQDRYIAILTEAGNKVTEALHLARQHQHETALPIGDERPISFADRVEAGRGAIALA
jgi:hypothetical protein